MGVEDRASSLLDEAFQATLDLMVLNFRLALQLEEAGVTPGQVQAHLEQLNKLTIGLFEAGTGISKAPEG